MERRGIKKFFRSHGSRGGATITTRDNPTHSKAVLNCSGNANRAELSRSEPCRAESYHAVEKHTQESGDVYGLQTHARDLQLNNSF